MDKTSIGDRMKNYEEVSKTKLTCRTPVIIRLDGKAFHTWTKRLVNNNGPFNEDMHDMMTFTTQFIMSNMQNAVFAYTQSDEISILLNDWKRLTTDQWFGNSVQKMVSVSASAATVGFNAIAMERGYVKLAHDFALFDSRAFNIPKEEVVNYFLWRQQDATRNSIQMLGHYYFSQKQMHGKNVSQVQDMLMEAHIINWNDSDVWKKRGTCVYANTGKCFGSDTAWVKDENIPIFSQDREYIAKFLESGQYV